jgi:hypothetical protein
MLSPNWGQSEELELARSWGRKISKIKVRTGTGSGFLHWIHSQVNLPRALCTEVARETEASCTLFYFPSGQANSAVT